MVRCRFQNSHNKSAETSLGAADKSVRATFISPEDCKMYKLQGQGHALSAQAQAWLKPVPPSPEELPDQKRCTCEQPEQRLVFAVAQIQ